MVERATNETRQWYALRVTYQREMRVKAELDAMKVANFVPMQYKIIVRNGRRVKKLVASIHNLIFVYMTTEEMRNYRMTTHQPVRYIMRRDTRQPLVVPKEQMDNFIAVAGTYSEQLIYLKNDLSTFNKGELVRILGGPFEGAVGRFVRVRGDRRVVVSVEGIVAVATTFIHPSLLEHIDESSNSI